MTASRPLTVELRAALRAEFPHHTAADLDAATVLGEGWSVTVLRVGDLAVRVARPSAPAPLAHVPPAPPPAFAREAALLAALDAAGVPFVPRGARVLRDTGGGALATAYKAVDGVPARGVPLRGEARERLARDLGAFLGALHAFPVAQARALGVPERDLWADAYVPLLAACRPHLGPRSRAWLDALVTRFLADGGTHGAPRALVHGDIAGAHLLLDPGGTLAGVIDFGDAMVADPALDFAGVLNDWPPAFLERVLTYYPLPVDADARRRAAFYIAVVPLFSVRYGVEAGDTRELAAGRRHLAARARRWAARMVPRAAPP
ncbi:MAG: aminoglycoside phosphotransferase family protein [Dehalococcoidia bacterium]|nr:aminoglycoside phosphotransferase family protein [Dehalococcoidia bacterium]